VPGVGSTEPAKESGGAGSAGAAAWTPRARVLTIVAVAACLAVAGTVGITLLQTRGESTTAPGSVTKPRNGRPPLFLEFGVRGDRQAQALSQAATLLNGGKAQQAGAIFARYHSLQAEIGAAFAGWPDGGLDELKRLVATHPESPAAQFNLGMAYLWSGRIADAQSTWQRVAARYPDSPESVEVENVLYPKLAPGPPPIVTTIAQPSAPSRAAQLQLLARAALQDDPTAKLRYGLALWQLWRRVSAERQFVAAAKLAPNNPVARTAAAVGAFRKAAPVRAFGRLGPLTAEFPHAAVVRFHLAILLAWTRQPAKALKEFQIAIADEPRSIYGKEGKQFVAALRQHGTK
jgi:tetratricopeptide (TPR) repeat protein